MNLMFWKKKKPAEEAGSDAPKDTNKTEVIEPSPALNGTSAHAPEAAHGPETGAADLVITRIRNKKRILLAAMAGGAFLLLTAIVVTAWMLLSSPDEKVEHPIETEQHETETKPAGEHDQELQAQLDALQKQNAELAAELEATKKNKGMEHQGNGETSQNDAKAAKNEITFSGDDPNASAQALKEAIEQMNAEDGKKSR